MRKQAIYILYSTVVQYIYCTVQLYSKYIVQSSLKSHPLQVTLYMKEFSIINNKTIIFLKFSNFYLLELRKYASHQAEAASIFFSFGPRHQHFNYSGLGINISIIWAQASTSQAFGPRHQHFNYSDLGINISSIRAQASTFQAFKGLHQHFNHLRDCINISII